MVWSKTFRQVSAFFKVIDSRVEPVAGHKRYFPGQPKRLECTGRLTVIYQISRSPLQRKRGNPSGGVRYLPCSWSESSRSINAESHQPQTR